MLFTCKRRTCVILEFLMEFFCCFFSIFFVVGNMTYDRTTGFILIKISH